MKERHRAAAWRRTAAWAALFLAAGLLGRATSVDHLPIAFVWPAAGVGILWLFLTDAARRPVEVVVLGAVAVGVNLLTDATLLHALVLGAANVANAVAGTAGLIRVSTPPRDELRDGRGLLAIGGAAVIGAVASAPLGVAILVVDAPAQFFPTAVIWVLRFAASTSVVLAFALAWRARRRRVRDPAFEPATVEHVVLLVVALGVNVAVFASEASQPYSFLTLPLTVAVGWRLGPAWTATYGLLVATTGVVGTVLGRGPFGEVGAPVTRTVLVQAFIAVSGLVGLALSLEVRQRQAALRALHRRGDALERTLQAAVVGHALVSLEARDRGEIRFANRALLRWWGDGSEEPLTGRSWFDLLDGADRRAFQDVLDELAEGRREGWNGELRHRLHNGEPRIGHASAARLWLPADIAGGSDVPVAGVQLVDVTARRSLEERLVHQALHDQLTGLPNRALLQERVQHALAAVARSGRSVALLFFDLDRFKQVNDTLGHAAGDQVLTAVASRLAHAVRPGDTVARVGGDEFVVCCPEIEHAGDADELAARIVEQVLRPVVVEDRTIEVSASVGVALAGAGANPAELLRRSDAAMYDAKASGRGAVRRAPVAPSSSPSTSPDAPLAGELRAALDEHRIVLDFQPIVDIDGGRVVAVEALARWDHPRRGMLLPAEWLPAAERHGLLPELGARIVRDALRRWPDLVRLHGHDVAVHVNVGHAELRGGRLAEVVARALLDSDVPPGRVVLELAESELLAVPDPLAAELAHLRALGVRIAVDHAGCGTASLTQLAAMPVDEVKIDRRLVHAMATEPSSSAVVHGMVAAARALDLTVVAEGVETVETAELVARAGCTAGQGYLWGRPGPVAGAGGEPTIGHDWSPPAGVR